MRACNVSAVSSSRTGTVCWPMIAPESTPASTNQVASGPKEISTQPQNQPRHKPAPPPLVAPHANDTNWMLDLGKAAIPDSTAAGRIHGRDFIAERAVLQNGTLTLRAGRNGTVEF